MDASDFFEISDPKCKSLVNNSKAMLTESDFSDSRRADIVIDFLQKMFNDDSNTILPSVFKEQDKQLLLLNLIGVILVLDTAFNFSSQEDAKKWYTKITKNVVNWFDGSTNETEVWEELKMKSIRILGLDLMYEFTLLSSSLERVNKTPSYCVSVANMSKLAHNFFKLQISCLQDIIKERSEKQVSLVSGMKQKRFQYTCAIKDINYKLRNQSLVTFYNKRFQTSFEHEFFSIGGKKLESIYSAPNVTDFAHTSELDPSLLFVLGFPVDEDAVNQADIKYWHQEIHDEGGDGVLAFRI